MAGNDGYFDIRDYTGAQAAPAIPQQTPAPNFLPTPVRTEAPTAAPAPQGGGLGLVPQEVMAAERAAGRRLTDDELYQVRDRIKAQRLPGMMPQGSQQFQYEQAALAFDSGFDDWKNKYYNAPGAGGTGTPAAGGRSLVQYATDPLAGGVAGVLKGVVGGALNLLDIPARKLNAAIGTSIEQYGALAKAGFNPFDKEYQKKWGYGKALDKYEQNQGYRTFLGDYGQAWNKGVDILRDKATSEETIADRTKVRQAWADDNTSVPEALWQSLAHPTTLLTEVTEVAGGFLGPGAATKLGKVASFLEAASPAMRRLAGATLIGAPQSANSVQDWASSVEQIPMADLMKIPENQAVAEEMRAISPYVTQEQIDKAVRDRTVGAGYNVAVASSMIANVGLAALPFFKTIEQRLAGAVPAAESRIGAAISTGASEAAEEALASGTETLGQNVAAQQSGQDVDLGRNVLKSGAQGGFLGALSGGGVASLQTPHAPTAAPGTAARQGGVLGRFRRAPTAAQPAAPTPAPATPGATPTPAQAAPEATPAQAESVVQAAATPNAGFDKIKKQFTTDVTESPSILRDFKKATIADAAELMVMAEVAAKDVLGDTWATLDRNQQLDIVATLAEKANKTRNKKVTGLEEAAAAMRAAAAPATPTEVPLTAAEARPDVPEFNPNAQPGVAAPYTDMYGDIPSSIWEPSRVAKAAAAGGTSGNKVDLAAAGFTPEEIAAMDKAGMSTNGIMDRDGFTVFEATRNNYVNKKNTELMGTPAPAAPAAEAASTAEATPAPAEPTEATPDATRETQLAQLKATVAAGKPVTISGVQKLFKLPLAAATSLAEEANASAPTTPAPKTPVQLTPVQKLQQEAQGWLNALMKRNDAADDQTQAYRDRPEYGAMVKAMNEGLITNEGSVRTQLAKAQEEVKNAAPKVNWQTSGEGRTQRIGDLVGMKGRLKASVLAAKKNAIAARAALISMGMTEEQVDALNLKGAEDAYNRLAAQGVRPAADVARPQVEETPAPKPTGGSKLKTKGTVQPNKQLAKPDGTVEIKNTKPEPQPVAGVNPLIQELKGKDGRRITRNQQMTLQATWDIISRTGQGSQALRKGIQTFTGNVDEAVFKQLDDQAGEQFSQRADVTQEQQTQAKEKAAREKPTQAPNKGRTAANVRGWIADLHAPGGTRTRISPEQQTEIESLYSRMLVQGGAPSALYNAVEQATGNADVAQEAVDRFNTEFEALGDTPNVLALAKLANVDIPAARARMFTDIASEQDANWRSADGRTALEVAVDAARRMKADKLKAITKAIARQAFDKESSRPKTKAPAQSKAAGAESSQKATKQPSAAELAQQIDPAVVEAQVMGVLGDNVLSNEMVRDLADAIIQSRLDEKANKPALTKMVNELLKDGDITLAQASELRKMGFEVKLSTANEHTKEAAEVQQNEPTDDTSDEALAARTSYLNDPMVEGAIDEALRQPLETRAETLLRMISVMPGVTAGQRWLAGRLATIVKGLNIDVVYGQEGEHASWGGWYRPNENRVAFNVATSDIVLHEFMHAITANMLVFAPTNPEVRRLNSQLTTLRSDVRAYFEANPDTAPDYVKALLKGNRGPLANNDELLAYGLTDKEFQRYLGRIPARGEKRASVWDSFKKYMADFFKPFTGNQRSALEALIDTTGQLVEMVAENPNVLIQNNEQRAQDKSDVQKLAMTIPNDGPPQPGEKTRLDMSGTDSLWRKFGVRFVDQTLGLEQVMQKLVRGMREAGKAGFAIPKHLNLSRAKILADGYKTQFTGEDTYEVINPATDYLRANMLRFGNTRDKAMENINTFFRNMTQLNRYHMMWLENVPLHAGMDIRRQRILSEVSDTPKEETAKIKQLRRDLETLVSQHAKQSEADYGRNKNAHYDRFRESNRELEAQFGINEASMADLNALLQNARDRIVFRSEQAGVVDENDPWITFYDDKYYVPLKGDPDHADTETYDFGDVDFKMSLNILNSTIKVAQGTTKSYKNGVERLLADTVAAGARAADGSFKSTLYDFVRKYKNELGAKIRVYKGRPKEGYEQVSGKERGKQREEGGYDNLPTGGSFVYSDGDMHYVVELPETSDLHHALQEYDAETSSWLVTEIVGKATNFLSKSYTVWKPWWTLATALLRDVTYVPVMLGVKDDSVMSGLGTMGKYYKSLLQNGMQLSNVSTAYNMIFTGNQAALQEIADRDKNSFASWLLRYQSAGGGSNIRGMFNSTKIRGSLTRGYDNADGLWKLALPVRAYDEWATGFGNVLENTSRVAAFRALVEDGIKAAGGSVSPAELEAIEREAAIDTKEVLNYDQKGIWSRSVNSYIAFFKVGMTSADAMRKTFTNPDGSFAAKRFAKWAGVFASIGFMGMAMARAMGGTDDEDGKEKLNKISLNTLTQNFVVYIDGKPHKIAIGLGLPQLLLGPGIIAESLMNGEVSASEAGRAFYELFARNAPLRPGGLKDDWTLADFGNAYLSSFLPTVAQPIAQLADNQSAFGSNIHRDFTGSEQFASEQGKATTEDFWKSAATMLREATGGKVDAFPETLKYLASSYGSMVPIDKISKITAAADESGSIDPLAAAKEIAGVEVRDPEYYYARELNKTQDALLPAVQEFNLQKNKYLSEGMSDKAARAAAESALNREAGLGETYRAYKALDKSQRTYYNERKKVLRNKALSKSRQDALMKRLDADLRRAIEAAKKHT